MPGNDLRPRSRIPAAMWGIALLFFLKAAALALFVTPLWDVPDEIAHFATVSDLASGRGIPRAGSALIPPEAVALWNPGLAGRPVYNWAAIHPPGYHALAVPFLLAARAATPDLAGQVRGTRLFSALCGAAGLLVFFLVMREAGADEAASLGAAAGAGFIPMYSHMSSGVSHDILCAFFGGLVALAWMRLIRSRSTRDALAVGLALAASGAVKATAVPVILALLPLLPARLQGPARRRLSATVVAGLVALSTTGLWALWRGRIPGSDARPAAGPARAATPLAFLETLRDTPILDHTFKNFFGLIGWTGTGKGTVAWFQISGPFLAPFLILSALLPALAAVWLWKRLGAARKPAALASFAVSATAFVAGFAWLASKPSTAWPKLLVYCLVPAVLLLSVPRVWRLRRAPESAVDTSQWVVLVFLAAYLVHVIRHSLAAGLLHGTHGRYFFVVLAFLLPAFALPADDLLAGWPWRNRALFLAVLCLFVNESVFFLARVLPFYRGGAAALTSP